jgi:peptide/nickel transport system substrate-binding protein
MAGGTVSRINPRRSVVVERIRVGGTPETLALHDGLVWVGISGPRGEPTRRTARAARPGGTLRLAAIVDALGGLDPQREFVSVSWAHELFRCCLLRTLFSYTGHPTNKGGAVPRPDLAMGPPRVSADGRTWTFRLKAGLHYAPPLAGTAIKTQDIIRALERTAKVGGLAAYFSVIEGFDDFRRGRADSISGLEAPTGRTLIVHLKRPSGDLAARFALATTAPIPPRATKNLPYDDYGRFLVASGPYMYEGSEALKFSPPAKRRPVSGNQPGRAVLLVRNPSWRRASDSLRPAYVDRIVIAIGGSQRDAERRIDEGRLDFVLDWNSSPTHAARYRGDPHLRKRVFRNPADIVSFFSMNLAIPPLDDVHVRKAVNLVVDKQAWHRLVLGGFSEVFGSVSGDNAGHIVLDSLVDNLLVAYDPYATPGRQGSLAAARAEMARSRYDRDRDGVCDARACRLLRAVSSSAEPTGRPLIRLMQRNLAGIGLRLGVVERLPEVAMFRKLADPREKIAMGLAMGWAKDFPNASSFIQPLFSRSSLGSTPPPRVPPNASLVGARPEQLRRWGYSVMSVPNLEAKLDQCLPLVGAAQAQCWAEADQFLMEKIVPVIPVAFLEAVRTVSARVASYSFAQSTAFPALDRIVLR